MSRDRNCLYGAAHYRCAMAGCECGCHSVRGVPLSDDQTRELSRATRQAASWTERRNTLIREALAAGAGVREVARACGLNHATVININKPRGQR